MKNKQYNRLFDRSLKLVIATIFSFSLINSPILLDDQLRLNNQKEIRFAGQITGVEGYVESTAIGLIAGKFAIAEYLNKTLTPLPKDTAIGALLYHITNGAEEKSFQPMNINFGLFPKIDKYIPKKQRKEEFTNRARASFLNWLKENQL